jgi:PAS domain-containing protein
MSIRSQLCSAIEKQPSQFFQKVQTLDVAGGETVLAVPLGQSKPNEEKGATPKDEPEPRREEGAKDNQEGKAGQALGKPRSGDMLEYTWRRVLLLKASAPQLPHGSLAFLVLSVLALFTVLGLRIYFERSHRARDHEDTLLRDLQVGVLDVSDGHVIEAANDRAEELLGTRLPTLGAKWDIADSSMFFDFVEDLLLFRNPDPAPEDLVPWASWKQWLPLTKEEVRRDRGLGLSYEYYARLKKGVKSRRGRLHLEGITQNWLRVRGSPILTSRHARSNGDRTFAVIHSLNKAIEDELDRALKSAKADQARGSS